ncbi:MAG: iron-sulfur cluster assembly protein [Phycisphaerae bacterium]
MRQVEERIIDAIRTVYDPELPINVYDLGLIYRIDVRDGKGSRDQGIKGSSGEEGAASLDPSMPRSLDASYQVDIDMTLTAPNCPVAGELPAAVQRAAAGVAGVGAVTVKLVWEPRWGRDKMSEAALLELGLL